MSDATWHIGDTLETLKSFPDESVDLVLSSPPFLALRSYLPSDHPDKGREMGSEATPGEFVDSLMLVVEECRRVLAPHGSIALELGDTFAGSGGAGGDYNENGLREGQAKFSGSAVKRAAAGLPDNDRPSRAGRSDQWPLAKSLSLVPETVRWTMVYGRNPHTGRETEPWRLRNVVRWCRPNPPVGALGDKYRPATTELMIFAKDSKRFFDLDAVRQPHARDYSNEKPTIANREFDRTGRARKNTEREQVPDPAGAPPLDYWVIPTQPYKGSHYATWPRKLLDVPIRSMVPQRVCRQCGKPSERITSEPEYMRTDTDRIPARLTMLDGERPADGVNQHLRDDGANTSVVRQAETVGWSDCGHQDWRNGIVLDPFAGSGTTLEVATGLGRDAIGIDLDERNYDLALQRVGMFLQVASSATL
ncbi:MAG: site-specific DNA-methyltransferase, partial [bacterium]|nr:site-specific DNA-methyltransferase [bacterium]